VIDRGLLSPATLTIDEGEPLEFANYSSEAIRLVFIEPSDSANDVRRRLKNPDATGGDDAMMRRPSFDSGATHQLTVTILPGAHTTTCSLMRGQYAFVTKRIGRDPRSSQDTLGPKGTISVE